MTEREETASTAMPSSPAKRMPMVRVEHDYRSAVQRPQRFLAALEGDRTSP